MFQFQNNSVVPSRRAEQFTLSAELLLDATEDDDCTTELLDATDELDITDELEDFAELLGATEDDDSTELLLGVCAELEMSLLDVGETLEELDPAPPSGAQDDEEETFEAFTHLPSSHLNAVESSSTKATAPSYFSVQPGKSSSEA